MEKSLHTIFILCLLALGGCATDSSKSASCEEIRNTFIKPTNGYSQAVLTESCGIKTLRISGQIGKGADLASQMRSAITSLEEILKEQGADLTDVVKMNSYIVDYQPEHLDTFRNTRKEIMGNLPNAPASTLVGVQALAKPEWLIEIEAVAVFRK